MLRTPEQQQRIKNTLTIVCRSADGKTAARFGTLLASVSHIKVSQAAYERGEEVMLLLRPLLG